MTRPASEPDRLLGFGGRGAWIIFGAFAVTTITLGLNGGFPSESVWGITAIVATLVAGAIGVASGPYPMPFPRVLAIIVLTTYCNAAITVQLTPGVWPGWAAWNFGLTAIVLFCLSLRGRILWSWVGLAAMCAIAITWSQVTMGDPGMGIQLVYMHAAINLAASLFALGLRRTVRRISVLRVVEAERASERGRQEAVDAERAAERTHLQTEVLPMLRRIASGATVDPTDARVLEARLRDRIRARRLEGPRLRTAIDAARRRGVDVVVLDDGGGIPLDDDLMDEAAGWAASVLDGQGAGRVTIRVAVAGDRLVLTITRDDAASVDRRTVSSHS